MLKRIVWLGLIILALLIPACAAESKPTIVIVAPPSGSEFRDGEEVAVQSVATDAKGIVRVELIVDNVIVRTDAAPSPQGQPTLNLIQKWQATPGTHTIIVRAYNTANAMSDPVAISINVLTTTAQASSSSSVVSSSSAASSSVSSAASTTSSAASSASSSSASGCTNNAAFVGDVTVPDGTSFNAGQTFNKTWRVTNNGTCTWGAGYQFVFVAGEAMATTNSIPVPVTAPGATIDLTIAMTAPATPGQHSGQWRLRASNGTLFGPTLTAKINTLGAPASSSSSASSVGGCSGTPNIASFTASPSSIVSGMSVTLSWGAVTNADSAEIDQGIGGVETPGSRTVSPTVNTTYTLTARCGANVATRQVTVLVLPPAVAIPPAPTLVSPADGWVFRNYPRTATFTWNAVSFAGGVTYNVEVQINTGTWQNHATPSGLGGTSYTMPAFIGDNQGRWRVWATSPTAGAGAKSDWRYFSFNTSASQYVGNWYNDDAATLGITKIFITNSGQTLYVHPYGKCTPTDCDWGTKSQTFNGEPFVISGFPAAHQLTITLNNPAGTSLKVMDFNGSTTYTYYFHK
jgi:hypothetical protein